MKKKPVSPKSLKRRGKSHTTNTRLSETVKKWAAFLVASGLTQEAAAERIRAGGIKISRESVSNAYRDYFNSDSTFPIPLLSNDELINNSRRLLSLYQLVVIYQSPEEREWGEISRTQEKLYAPLWNQEDLQCRDEILALERIMTEEDMPEDLLEILQKRYDKLNERLKG